MSELREKIARAIYEAKGYDYDGRTIDGKERPYGKWASALKYADAALSVIAAESGWRTIESAPDDREWTPETPFHFKSGVAVAYDDETVEPLFLVWYAPCQGGCETTHWMPLPPAPFRHRRRAG